MSAVHWEWDRNVAKVLGEQGDQGTGPSGHGKEKKNPSEFTFLNSKSTQEKRLMSFIRQRLSKHITLMV